MNQLSKVFNYQERQVRTVVVNNEPWFVAKDVCEILEIGNVTDVVNRLTEKMKATSIISTQFGNKEMNIVSEAGVYKLVFTSRKPEAERFTDWIATEVIPSIRKHGMYATDELLDNPDFLIKTIQTLKEEREQRKLLESKVEQDKPKVLFADAVTTSTDSVLVHELATVLKQKGVKDKGEKKLFKWLRENGYLCKGKGEDYNLPTFKSMNLKVMEIKKTTIILPDGSSKVQRTPKITGKGQIYFVNKFLGENQSLAIV